MSDLLVIFLRFGPLVSRWQKRLLSKPNPEANVKRRFATPRQQAKISFAFQGIMYIIQ
jgi:hypothetical protein